jgi:hypothetical protein
MLPQTSLDIEERTLEKIDPYTSSGTGRFQYGAGDRRRAG